MAGLISDAELNEMREQCREAFPDVAVVKRATAAAGTGLQTGTPATVETTVCLVTDVDDKFLPTLVGYAAQGTVAKMIYKTLLLPYDSTVKENDTIEVGSTPVTYKALRVDKDFSWFLYHEVHCSKVS